MIPPTKTFHRYVRFNTNTLDSLCEDTLHFAQPGSFNDPLDCKPTLECDSDLEQLREVLALLFERRVIEEKRVLARKADFRDPSSDLQVAKRAKTEAARELADIAYHATNPEHGHDPLENEKWILTWAIRRELLKHYERGVCCFSTTPTSPLLWSHYGDQHHGICIGYSTDRNPKPNLEKVEYGGDRRIKTSTLIKAFIHAEPEAVDELDRAVLLRKAPGWRYEREWRLIGSQGVQNSPLLLKEVTFGLRCSPSVKHAVVQSLASRSKPVRFYEIHEVPDRFGLRRRKWGSADFAPPLPHVAESVTEMLADFPELNGDSPD
jgi:hypothetical protein